MPTTATSMVIGDQLDARLRHARTAHSEKTARRCVRRSAVASRAAYISLEASPAEIRISERHARVRTSRGTTALRQSAVSAKSVIGGKRLRESGRPGAGKGNLKLLFLVLKLVEAVVNSAQRQQFLMRALFAQPAFVEHQNAIARAEWCSGDARSRRRCVLRAGGRALRESAIRFSYRRWRWLHRESGTWDCAPARAQS